MNQYRQSLEKKRARMDQKDAAWNKTCQRLRQDSAKWLKIQRKIHSLDGPYEDVCRESSHVLRIILMRQEIAALSLLQLMQDKLALSDLQRLSMMEKTSLC